MRSAGLLSAKERLLRSSELARRAEQIELPIVPEVVLFFPTDDPQQATQISGIAKNLRILRTLRTLKAVVRFGSLRVIVHTILNAFQSMSFILITLLMVAYIVAVFGVQIFEQYTYSEEPGLLFQEKFRNIGEALLTLFQLLSLDQWYAIQRDIAKVVSPVVTGLYFIGKRKGENGGILVSIVAYF